MMRVTLSVFTLMFVISIAASHDIGQSIEVGYSYLPPWVGEHSYFKTNPLFVGYPVTYFHSKPRTETPAVTILEVPAVIIQQVPVVTIPEVPAVIMPEAPAGTVPKAPAVTTPEAPAVIMTEATSVTIPEVPTVTMPTANDTSEDLYGCNTDYGPWWTPDYCRQYLIHWSATSDNKNLTLSLLQAGRDINLQHNVERTALHIASHWGRPSMVSLLLKRGADMTLTDMWGYTALELAEFKKCDDEEYFKTWLRSCTKSENNYPETIALLKAGCQKTGCTDQFHCVEKRCIKL